MAIITPLTLSNKLHTYNYTIGSKTKFIHMSNNDSLDEETKRILAEVDAQSGSDDSIESKKKEYEKNQKKDVGYDDVGNESTDIRWEENTIEDPDSEW